MEKKEGEGESGHEKQITLPSHSKFKLSIGLPSFPLFKPFDFPTLQSSQSSWHPPAIVGFDLMEAILLTSSPQDRKNAISNVKSILDAFANELKLYQRSLIWTIEIFNLAFQLDDLDWIHFVLFSIFANVVSIYQLFLKISNGDEHIRIKLQTFHSHLLQSQDKFLHEVYVDENRKVYTSRDEELEGEGEVESNRVHASSPNLRKFIQDMRMFYLSL